MFQIKQSEATAARRRIPVLFVSSTDGFTPTTPTSPAAYISTNGGTFVATTNAVTLETLAAGQSASGCYYIELTATEVATLGVINVNVQSTNCRQYNAVIQVMAYDAYDAVRIGMTALPNATAGASGGLPTGNASGQVSVATLAANSITNSVIDATAATEIAGAVWDEPYASHTTAGTMGKLMDILRKSNYVTEGTVSASGTPANSTTYFRTSLTGSDNFYNDQTLLFVSGTLSGQAMHLETFTSTNGVVTTSDGLTATPTAGDSFVVLGAHAWSQAQIADGVLARKLDSTGNESVLNGAYTSVSTDRTVRQALRILRNKVDASTGATIDVYNEAGTVVVWSLPLTTALADPIVKVG